MVIWDKNGLYEDQFNSKSQAMWVYTWQIRRVHSISRGSGAGSGTGITRISPALKTEMNGVYMRSENISLQA